MCSARKGVTFLLDEDMAISSSGSSSSTAVSRIRRLLPPNESSSEVGLRSIVVEGRCRRVEPRLILGDGQAGGRLESAVKESEVEKWCWVDAIARTWDRAAVECRQGPEQSV
jgi:hypothetical protein